MYCEKIKRITLPCIPRGQERVRYTARNGKAIVYKSERQKATEKELHELLSFFRPKKSLVGAFRLEIYAFLPIPKGKPKCWRQGAEDRKFRPKGKPDLDNMVKLIMDAMTRAEFWEDDAQILEIQAGKYYSENPRWEIEITNI